MSLSPDELDRLHASLCALRDDCLEPAEQAYLQSMVLSDAGARQLFVRAMHFQASLLWKVKNEPLPGIGQPALGEMPGSIFPQAEPIGGALPELPADFSAASPSVLSFVSAALGWSASWLSSPKGLGLTVAAGLLSYFVFMAVSIALTQAPWANPDRQRFPSDAAAASPGKSARVADAAGARWEDPEFDTRLGAQLPAGTSRLIRGAVEIQFARGARVRIEGPAEFAPRSGGRMELTRGRVVAYVPRQARGFTIGTPMADVVDLGTEFGVEVGVAGNTEVHVLRGEVAIKSVGNAAQRKRGEMHLMAGEAVRVTAADAGVRIPLAEQRFAWMLQPLAAQRDGVPAAPQASDSDWGQLVRQNPDLVAYYPMNDSPGSNIARNATGQDGFYFGGVNLGTPGPRPPQFPCFSANNTAATCDGTRGLMVVNALPTLHADVYSFEMWFQVGDVTADLQYLGGRGEGDLTYDAVGLSNGRLLFFNGQLPRFADKILTTNSWYHLVYTRQGAAVKVYLDGEVLISDTFLPTYGASQRIVVGVRPDQALPTGGAYDELAIYNAALSAEEIHNHFQRSRP